MRTIRIFISSPGDVEEERERAKEVVESLRRRYSGRFYLKPVRWEELPLQADTTFQRGIDLVLSKEHGIDIAVFILWSRLGSLQGGGLRRADGRECRSGTERELDLMLKARETSGGARPALLVYTREDESGFEERLRGEPTVEKEKLIAQKKLVEQFIKEEFQDDSGQNLRAYHSFDRPVTFMQRLQAHLVDLLDELAGGEVSEAAWDIGKKGAPFLGLEAFQPEHADVFFGRELEILEARHCLRKQARNGCGFLLLSGASGSGKSSLARAGVLPSIAGVPPAGAGKESDENVSKWKTLIVTPVELGSDPVGELARRLSADNVMPELQSDTDGIESLIEGLKGDAALTVKLCVREAFARASKRQGGEVRVLLVLDQLEEFFTGASASEAAREEFFDAVEVLARCGHVWVMATVRSDFSAQIQSQPALVRMLEGGGTLHLLAPRADAMRRLIEEPARLAGLSFEKRDEQSLADRILRDAAGRGELLPMLEYVLRDLFEKRSGQGVLTWSEYENVGGVEGALAKRAEEVFQSLPPEVKSAFDETLWELVTFSQDGEAVRRLAPLPASEDNSAHAVLVRALIKERFLTAGEAGGHPTAGIAHEAILSSWPRIGEWVRENRDLLRIRHRVEEAEQLWREKNQHKDYLLAPGLPLAEAESLLSRRRDTLDQHSMEFIGSSSQAAHAAEKRKTRVMARWIVAISGALVVAVILAAISVLMFAVAVIHVRKEKTAKAQAIESKNAADELISYMQYDLSDRLRPLGYLEMMGEVNARILEYQKRFPAEYRDYSSQSQQCVALDQQGDILQEQGKLKDALIAYQKALGISTALAARDKTNAEWQDSLAYSYKKVGGIYQAQGNLEKALDFYQQSLQIMKALAEQDKTNPGPRRALSDIYDSVGCIYQEQGNLKGALNFYQQSLQIMQVLAEQDKRNSDWQHALSLSHNSIGRVYQRQGDLTNALNSFQKYTEIMQVLAEQDKTNSSWQRELSVSFHNVGGVCAAQGNLAKALNAYNQAILIRKKLVAQDKSNARWQCDLSCSYNGIGEVYNSQGNLEEAFNSFQKSLQIMQALATKDQTNSDWQHALSCSYSKTAGVYEAQGNLEAALNARQQALQIMKTLAAQDKTNSDWQRELSASYDGVGRVYQAQGNLEAARNSYQQSLQIMQALAGQDKTNPGWQRDLAVSYSKNGGIFLSLENLEEALKAHQQTLQIMQALAGMDKTNSEWQRDLAVAYSNVATVFQAQGNLEEALKAYQLALQIAQTLAAQDKTNADLQHFLAINYNEVSWLLATSPDPRLRNGAKAVEYARKGCELTEWKDNYMIKALAAAYAETKDFKKAVIWEKKYLELKPFDKEGQERLALYQKGEPYHVEMKAGH